MSKKIITCVLTLAMIFSAFSNPALGYATTGQTGPDVTDTTAVEDNIPEIGTVKNLKVSAVNHGAVKLTWSKVSGATEYHVYRYSSKSKKYIHIKTVKGNSFENTGLAQDTLFTYKVRACLVHEGIEYKGEYSAAGSCRTKPYVAKVTGLSAVPVSHNAVKLTWNKVSGATGYQVYRYSKAKGKYILIKTVKSNSYENTGLIKSTSYTYKVRAYKVKNDVTYNGLLSEYAKCKTNPYVSKVTNLKVTPASSSSVKISWSKVSGASGYQVYRYSTAKGKYVLLFTTKKTSVQNTGLKSDTSFNYKVRAYTLQDGKKFLGEFSKTVKCRTEKTDRAKVGSLAYSKVGSPYKYGAKGPKCFDCSGFVYWVYSNAKVTPKKKVPNTNAAGMYSALKNYKIGSSIKSINKAKMGDIIFFKYGGRISHVGLYYKDGKMIHAANPKKDVCIEKVSDYNKWGYKVVGIVSVLK